jgi:hypothetical protein
MTLSEVMKMKQKHPKFGAFDADLHPRTAALYHQTSRNSAEKATFSAAC